MLTKVKEIKLKLSDRPKKIMSMFLMTRLRKGISQTTLLETSSRTKFKTSKIQTKSKISYPTFGIGIKKINHNIKIISTIKSKAINSLTAIVFSNGAHS